MPIYIVFSLSVLFLGLYFILIGPILFKFWIIPKIEHRYHNKLLFNHPAYSIIPFVGSWSIPPFEISMYIFSRWIGWHSLYKDNLYTALNKINYNIKTASKSEIIISFFTVFFLVYLVVACMGVLISKQA